mgnify:CR=1 FL=1
MRVKRKAEIDTSTYLFDNHALVVLWLRVSIWDRVTGRRHGNLPRSSFGLWE